MLSSISAELLVLRKRRSTWVLLGLWTLMSVLFGYVFAYIGWLNNAPTGPADAAASVFAGLLPSHLVGTFLEGYPFFGGVIVLILGALAFGSEYGWGTWKTVFTQRPSRIRIFGAKLAALGVVLAVFVLVPFVVEAITSYIIAVRENVTVAWPSAWLIVRGLAAAWFLMAVWTGFGAMLAVLARGTSLAIGIGILYGLAIEGLVSAFVEQVSALRAVSEGFLRTNGYSLVESLGIASDQVRGNGPGAFAGPYVGSLQAALVLAAYLGAFVLLAAVLLRRRDVV